MIYFFHHYELPVIIQQAQVQQILRLRTRQRHHQQQQAGNGSGVANNNGTNQQQNDMPNMPNNVQPNDAAAPPNNHRNINNNNNNINNNNNNFNANRNIVIHIGNFFNQHMTATLIINRALNIVGAVRNVIANDIFGVAAIFNNNNDNNLNNNNANGGPTSHIRINLANLRRINLSGIQINPIERNDDAVDGNVDGENDATTNNENRPNENLDGNEIDGDMQFQQHYDAETESTDECDNLLKKHVRSEEELHQHQQQQDQLKILDLNEVSEKNADITFASVENELPKATAGILIDDEIHAANCHGDPDSIGIAHFAETLNANDVTASTNVIDKNQDKLSESVAGNHDFAFSICSSTNDSDSRNHDNGIERCTVIGDDNNDDDCHCIGATIEKIDSIIEDWNLNSTGDSANESGSRHLANNDNECTAPGSDNSNSNSRTSSCKSRNISDSCEDSCGNRLPIVTSFK